MHPRAYVGGYLNLRMYGKVLRGNAAAANRTREIRPSGMRGGLAESWTKVDLGTRGAIKRAPIGNSPPKVARAAILPDRTRVAVVNHGLPLDRSISRCEDLGSVSSGSCIATRGVGGGASHLLGTHRDGRANPTAQRSN